MSKSMIIFEPSVNVNGGFSFPTPDGTSNARLHISKKDTKNYAIAVELLSNNESQSKWKIDFCPIGSKKSLAFFVPDLNRIDIESVGPNRVELRINEGFFTRIFGCRRKTAIHVEIPSGALSAVENTEDGSLENLIENAKAYFKVCTSAIKLKKIFYHQDVGVITYAIDSKGEATFHYAKIGDRFVECEAKMLQQCRCPRGDSKWEVRLPGDSTVHIFEFPKGDESYENSHGKTEWDGLPLKTVVL